MTLSEDKIAEMTKALIAQGKLIEAGWIGLRFAAMPADAGQVQIEETRQAFFAGAQHVFASLMTALAEGEEPTEADDAVLDSIKAELDEFIADFNKRHFGPRQKRPVPPVEPVPSLSPEPVDAEYIERMRAVMATVDEFFNGKRIEGQPRHVGVVLLVIDTSKEKQRSNFMSNGLDRNDIKAVFKEIIARWEGQPANQRGTA